MSAARLVLDLEDYDALRQVLEDQLALNGLFQIIDAATVRLGTVTTSSRRCASGGT
jgi:hypothetical protein